MKPRNATSATKAMTVATPLLSVLLLVESPTANATQELENAAHASQVRIKTAHKLRPHVIKNAQSNPCQDATET